MTPDDHEQLARHAVEAERSGDPAARRLAWRRLAALPRPDAEAVAGRVAAIKGEVPVPPAAGPADRPSPA